MRCKWMHSKRNQFFLLLIYGFVYILYKVSKSTNIDSKKTVVTEKKVFVFLDTDLAKMDVDKNLRNAWLEDKGTGCQIPNLNPYDKEIVKFMEKKPRLVCPGYDWVRCDLATCKVRETIFDDYKKIKCVYRDIVYESDQYLFLAAEVWIAGNDTYQLLDSDHVLVQCSGIDRDYSKLAKLWYGPTRWTGMVSGFRINVKRIKPKKKLDTINVMILAIDSASKNAFMRYMPKSFNSLMEDGNTILLNGYNVVGDGTAAALFPLLLGATPLELPDRRKSFSAKYVDDLPFIFYKLRDRGFRTAYFEDAPTIGTFQHRFNGFGKQPTDHYLYPLFMTYEKNRFSDIQYKKHCLGDTPTYMVMLNATDQFFKLDGNKFIFTFIVDLCHYDFNRIATADDDLAYWLQSFKERGLHEDTMLILMGDHGYRFGPARQTLVGKLEERLPLMAIRLPDKLKLNRPSVFNALRSNQDVLTTVHDVHATILDALNMRKKCKKRHRAYTLLRPIPKNRSCSEAGIERHWCSCLRWSEVSMADPIFKKAGWALLRYINVLTSIQRILCAVRTMISVDSVERYVPDVQLLKFREAKDEDNFMGVFDADTKPDREEYNVKISVGPGYATYEATIVYYTYADEFHVDQRFISRTNTYNKEADCITEIQPHLSKYCYCIKHLGF